MERDLIIKALECCANGGWCIRDGCPFYKDDEFGDIEKCTSELTKNALALITSQEQRIEELTKDLHATRTELTRVQEENERLQTYLDEHFPKCIYQYDGDVQEYCVLGPCGQFKTVADFQKQIEADTVREMQERLEGK